MENRFIFIRLVRSVLMSVCVCVCAYAYECVCGILVAGSASSTNTLIYSFRVCTHIWLLWHFHTTQCHSDVGVITVIYFVFFSLHSVDQRLSQSLLRRLSIFPDTFFNSKIHTRPLFERIMFLYRLGTMIEFRWCFIKYLFSLSQQHFARIFMIFSSNLWFGIKVSYARRAVN